MFTQRFGRLVGEGAVLRAEHVDRTRAAAPPAESAKFRFTQIRGESSRMSHHSRPYPTNTSLLQFRTVQRARHFAREVAERATFVHLTL